MSMEKIKKEELPETPGGAPLSDDELEDVTGGVGVNNWLKGKKGGKKWVRGRFGSDNDAMEKAENDGRVY